MGTIPIQFSNYLPGETDLEEITKYPMAWREYEPLYDACPGPVWDILFGSKTFDFMMDLSVAHNFSEFQTRELSRIVRDTLLGKQYLGDMPAAIQERLHIDAETARTIANTSVRDLFAPALEDIKKVQVASFPDRIRDGKQPNVINLKNK